jgi:cytochrome oxidase Cu insertion factor (SCO1/SenC/PrrC family)
MSNGVQKKFTSLATAGTLALALTGCGGSGESNYKSLVTQYHSKTNPDDSKNLFNILKSANLKDQDGNAVTAETLKTMKEALHDQFTTLTFGFGDCTEYCPMINSSLAGAGKGRKDKLTSIIISVNPDVDGATPESRAKFLNHVRHPDPDKPEIAVEQNIILLYPTSQTEISRVAASANIMTNPLVQRSHSQNITLYAPGGMPIDRKKGADFPEKFDRDWGKIIEGGTPPKSQLR